MAAGGYKATLIGGGQRSEGMAELGWGMVSNARNMIRTGGNPERPWSSHIEAWRQTSLPITAPDAVITGDWQPV